MACVCTNGTMHSPQSTAGLHRWFHFRIKLYGLQVHVQTATWRIIVQWIVVVAYRNIVSKYVDNGQQYSSGGLFIAVAESERWWAGWGQDEDNGLWDDERILCDRLRLPQQHWLSRPASKIMIRHNHIWPGDTHYKCKKTVVYKRVNGALHIENCKNYKKVITHQHIA